MGHDEYSEAVEQATKSELLAATAWSGVLPEYVRRYDANFVPRETFTMPGQQCSFDLDR
ncbi:hypothetical protein PENSUB_3344 [Penicillium subrubescens]|jgi:hypothetical protein|uniref:Uncharacterized protein n=1 Tax=Penicillium subrubescens TaxID=1316194 RepID=A0A1Q5UFB3_9EURO|nr:hypothetical protein PENSUB_3344 [Penicillium subrubescens]